MFGFFPFSQPERYCGCTHTHTHTHTQTQVCEQGDNGGKGLPERQGLRRADTFRGHKPQANWWEEEGESLREKAEGEEGPILSGPSFYS